MSESPGTDSSIWVTESDDRMQTAAIVIAIAVGLSLAIGSQYAGGWSSGTIAAALLGLMVLGAGSGMLLFGGKQTITVDTGIRRIDVERRSRFGGNSMRIDFDQIADAYVDEIGDNEGGSISYHVMLKLKSGKEIPLYMGFFDGRTSKPAMQARCQRLMQCVRGTGASGVAPLDSHRDR